MLPRRSSEAAVVSEIFFILFPSMWTLMVGKIAGLSCSGVSSHQECSFLANWVLILCCCSVICISPWLKMSRTHSMLGLRGATKISTYLNFALANSLGQKGPSCPVLSSEGDSVWTVCVGVQGLLLTCLWAVEGTDWILSDRNRMCSGSPLKNTCKCGYHRN